MNLRNLLTLTASILGFAAAEESRKSFNRCSLNPADKCTQELEGIVYQPATSARAYLERIGEQIKISSPILWTENADSFLQSFEAKYNVIVEILDAFGSVTYPAAFVGNQFYYSTTSTANMNGTGFTNEADETMGMIMSEFIVYNQFGELKYVLIKMMPENAPIKK